MKANILVNRVLLSGCWIILFTLNAVILPAQQGYTPTKENLEAREWFRDAKFGMFIHWGVYSQMAGGGDMGIAEWIMERKEIPIEAYEMLPGFFNPTQFDAEEWVKIAKSAGMKYITITSKHHDGFAMYDSKISDYNIVDSTPYGKDVLKQLKEACDQQGLKLFFYHSQLDWHHPDYYPRGRTGQGYTGRPENGDWNRYINYMNAQLTELLTNYGDIGGIWFDGMWDQWSADWQLEKTYSLIHKLQPGALIGSNHHKAPFPGEDFQMFERDLPGENTMGFNQTSSISPLPLEMCETMNGSWGYNINDRRFKSSKTLIQTMVKAAGFGANFLLNTGPMPNGKLQPENIDTLKVIGSWLEKYGDTIYGTGKGPVTPKSWGATTFNKEQNKVYIHILDLTDETLLIPDYQADPKTITFFDDGSKVEFEQSDYGLLLRVPKEKRKPIDTIIEIQSK
ncbi:MAG: alpha-L-fucosidase [Bacteroidetes bacterium]|nr:alpha-L-fucosidase [Bacteroidota bacterium]